MSPIDTGDAGGGGRVSGGSGIRREGDGAPGGGEAAAGECALGGEYEFGELGGGVGPAEVAAGASWRAEEGAEGGGFVGGLGKVEEGEWG